MVCLAAQTPRHRHHKAIEIALPAAALKNLDYFGSEAMYSPAKPGGEFEVPA